MSSSRNKRKARKDGRETGPIHTTNNSKPTTDTKGRRWASPGGQPALSPAIQTGNDDNGGPTHGVLSMPLKTDQLFAAIIDSSQEMVVDDE